MKFPSKHSDEKLATYNAMREETVIPPAAFGQLIVRGL